MRIFRRPGQRPAEQTVNKSVTAAATCMVVVVLVKIVNVRLPFGAPHVHVPGVGVYVGRAGPNALKELCIALFIELLNQRIYFGLVGVPQVQRVVTPVRHGCRYLQVKCYLQVTQARVRYKPVKRQKRRCSTKGVPRLAAVTVEVLGRQTANKVHMTIFNLTLQRCGGYSLAKWRVET